MDDTGPTYLRAVEKGDLVADVVGALWWDRGLGLAQIPDLVRRRKPCPAGRFRPTSVKIMQDGVLENGTAALVAPYLDRCGHATDNAGHSFVDADELQQVVVALSAEGFQVHVHAIGDRGVREALDAFAAARTAGTMTSCAITSPTSRSSTPTTSRASPSSASRPTPRRCGPATRSR